MTSAQIDLTSLSTELNKIGYTIPKMEELIGMKINGDDIGSEIKSLIWAIIKDPAARGLCMMYRSRFPCATIAAINPGGGSGGGGNRQPGTGGGAA